MGREFGSLRLAGAKTQDPTPKITKAKRAGDLIQVLEHLSNKHKSLSEFRFH
jgi:hypothetical protein